MKILLALLPALAAAALRSKVAHEVHAPSVHSMEAAVAGLMRRGSQPVNQELLRQIKALLRDTVMPHLLQQHHALQAQLDDAPHHFEECKATLDVTKTALLSDEHAQCRHAESAAMYKNSTCTSELESLRAASDEHCRAFDELNQIPSVSCTMQAGENATGWYARMLTELHWAKERLAQSEARCDAARSAHVTKMGICSTVQKDRTSLTESCDAKQLLLDQAACDSYDAALANCSAEEACYKQRRASHDALLTNARQQEKTLKVEFAALLRLECFLETLMNRSHREAAIDACKDQEYDTQTVSLVYPSKSPAASCSVSGDLKPGTTSYERRMFVMLPEELLKPCTATCCGQLQRQFPKAPSYQAVQQCYNFRAAYIPPLMQGEQRTVEDTAQDCQHRCKQTAGCGAFSYSWDGGCFITHQSASKIFQPGVIAGPMDCLGIPSDCYSYNKKFTPELDGHVAGHVASEEECQKQCFDTVGCGHWVLLWDMSCHLAGGDAVMSYQAGTVSGPSQCAQVASVVT